MDMQDKDMDKLFQSALDDYEVEPSAKVWTGITSRLDAGKNKRLWMPFLSIAAGLVLLVTIGVLFIPKQVKVNPTKADNNLVKNSPVIKPASITKPVQIKDIAGQNKKQQQAVIAPVNNLAILKKHTTNNAVKSAKLATTTITKPTTDAIKSDDQSVLASAQRSHDIANPVLPDNGTPIMIKQTLDNAPTFASIPTPAAAMATLPVVDKQQAAPVKKRRIRSFGDVLNVVIAAVDKREKKVIQFSNTDGDDATITGVNFGIIKISKDK